MVEINRLFKRAKVRHFHGVITYVHSILRIKKRKTRNLFPLLEFQFKNLVKALTKCSIEMNISANVSASLIFLGMCTSMCR